MTVQLTVVCHRPGRQGSTQTRQVEVDLEALAAFCARNHTGDARPISVEVDRSQQPVAVGGRQARRHPRLERRPRGIDQQAIQQANRHGRVGAARQLLVATAQFA